MVADATGRNLAKVRMRQDRLAACDHIYRAWHERAKARDIEGLLALYADNAVLESPLVPALLPDVGGGRLTGREEIGRFLDEGTCRRPNALVRWYRTGDYFADGRLLIWEYPRETPDGEQVDILEVMEIEDGLIVAHRIYWGWFGGTLLIKNAVDNAVQKIAGGVLME